MPESILKPVKDSKGDPVHFTNEEIFNPETAKIHPELAQYFTKFGITPADATDVNKSIEWAARELEQSFKSKDVEPYGIKGAIGYYNKGHHWMKGTDHRTWYVDTTSIIPSFVQKASTYLPPVKGQKDTKISVPYIESVEWIQKLIEDAVNRCISSTNRK